MFLQMGGVLTVSELIVFGTAIKSSSERDSEVSTRHCAKEQKFMVFTWRTWSSHGCLRVSGGVSTGRTVLMEASSSSENLHTMSLLSLPCLSIHVRFYLNPRYH
jgi:hypothetical protein